MCPLVTSRQIEDQERFHLRVLQEWRRAERSSRPALLILFDGLETIALQREAFVYRAGSLFRDTDVLGWYATGKTLGVICLELGKSVLPEARQAIISKIDRHLLSVGTPGGPKVKMIIHALPPYAGDPTLTEPDAEFAESFSRLMTRNQPWAVSATKRAFDIAGSGVLLLLLLPILLAIAAAIRLTSRGPALYRQVRTGLGGRAFSLYKFRTMRADADDRQHLEYVQQFIHGKAEKHLDDRGQAVYKLTGDPRITPVGRFLRRSSLDELPQLWNVLYGDMTLVGPRPPLPFEVECYDLWHRRRVFELKPGLTGLWQVRGRSRCSFDEMIRLDLQHGKPNSLALYLRVLLETPRAVISGGGAQ